MNKRSLLDVLVVDMDNITLRRDTGSIEADD